MSVDRSWSPPHRAAVAGSVAAAIASAGPGGTVILRGGVYREPLLLRWDVELVGEPGGAAVVFEVSGRPAVVVTAGRITLRGIQIRGGGEEEPTVRLVDGELTLHSCDVQSHGALAVHASRGRLQLSTCTVTSPDGSGLLLDDRVVATITDTSVTDVAGVGVVIADGADPVVERCHLSADGGPALLSTMDGMGTVKECDITSARGPGVAVEDMGAIRVFNSRIHHTAGPGVVVTGGRPVIDGCELAEIGAAGLTVAGAADVSVLNTRMRDLSGPALRVEDRARVKLVNCVTHQTAIPALVAAATADLIVDNCDIDEDG